MAAAKRPSPELSNKINVIPVGNRFQEATAEDYIETAEILNDHAAKLDALTGTTSGKQNFGSYTSLALLQAAYPVGTANAYAIIDAGVGATPQLALWDSTDLIWTINSVAENVKFVTNFAALPAPGLENMIYITLDNFKAYVWKNGQYNPIFTPKNTSDLINNGEDTVNPFITFKDIYAENQVLVYSIQWIKDTYSYIITVRKYIFNGVLHTNTIVSAPIILDVADLTFNRFDSFLIDANENIIKWTGDAVEFPYPKEFDVDIYVFITFVRVDANTTSPTGVSEILWYNENLQEVGGEKNTAINSGTVVLASLEQASIGTKSIKLVNKGSAWLKSTTNYLGSDLSNVLLDVYCATAVNNRLRLQFWIAETMRVGEIYVSHGQFNFNAFLVGQYQTLTIPGSAFNTGWGNWQYNWFWVGNDKTGSTIYVDNVRFQQGLGATSSTATHTHSNLSVLEQITQALLNAWNAAVTKLSTIEANATADQTGPEIKALYEAEADTNAFTDAEKTKLANAETPHFKGLHLSEAALIIAHPSGVSGDFADVDAGVGADVARWIWDVSDDKWVVQSGVIAGETSASIKAKYEANADTNAFTDDEKTKLGTIEANADVTDAVNLGSAVNGATAKPTPIDADTLPILDSAASFGLKKVTWANVKTALKNYFDTIYQPIGGVFDLNSATVTTNISITSATLTDAGQTQDGKVVKIANGVAAINYTVNGITASYIKGGTGAITFVQGLGRTLTGVNATFILNGAVNSSASIVSFGTTDILYINNL